MPEIVLNLGMKYKLLLVFVTIASIVFLSVYGSFGTNRNNGDERTYPTLVRLIGHRLLRSAGDNHSRVMPTKQLSSLKFQIHFENELSLVPDSIFKIISTTTKSSSLPDEYTTEIVDATNDEIVYSFVMSDIDSNVIVPCLERNLPMGRYYVNIDFSASDSSSSNRWYISIGFVLLGIFFSFVYLKRKNKRPLPGGGNPSTVFNSIAIGKFLFFFDQRHLTFSDERIELTEKESKLLHIFALAPNKVIDREQLQKEVWENEGVIVARSLDVFISKLRKKLDKDPEVKLINVHGKGYKLETPIPSI